MLSRAFTRTAAARSAINWAALTSSLDGEAVGAINRFRAVVGEVESLSTLYSAEPLPIDFESYRSKLTNSSVVDDFEAEYSAVTFPKFEGAIKPEFESKSEEIIANASDAVAESKAAIAELETRLTAMNHIRHGNPSVTDVYAAYPEIQAEVDEEIETHQWCKDIN